MTHSATRSRPRADAWIAALALLALSAGGCVTRGKHESIVGALEQENADLSTRVRDLERSNKSLDEERVKLLDEMENLREVKETLASDIEKLTKTRDLLTEHLRKRESEVEELSQLKSTYSGLVSELESEVATGQIQIEQLRDGIRLNLPQEILFPSGSAALDPRGEAVLLKVAGKLQEPTHRIEVQGHTDNVPISGALTSRFATNWELAAARAARVVRLFESAKIDATRLSAISHGQWQPVAPNDDPKGRALNRRIEIRLIPTRKPELDEQAGGGGQPGTSGPSAQASPSEGVTPAP